MLCVIGFVATLFTCATSVYPFVDVPEPLHFAVKISVTIVLTNLIGYGFLSYPRAVGGCAAGGVVRYLIIAPHLEICTGGAIKFLRISIWARGFGGRHASTSRPRQLKEVIQVAHTIVGSVASLGRWLVAGFVAS